VLKGAWTRETRPDLSGVLAEIEGASGLGALAFESGAVTAWDSVLLVSLEKLRRACEAHKVTFDIAGLPEGVQGLLKLAWAVPERAGARRTATRKGFLERFGERTLEGGAAIRATTAFLGEVVIGFANILRGRARYRRSDVMLFIQEAGAEALPIVTLISVLVGTILAFVGSIQLVMFGAEIYVADLVGVGMAVEMGALMTGIIMAGRTGASYAAQLGTMQVNEEIDALQTLGVSPFEFLVLPRLLALILMMPLLCLYADLLGILGGAVVGIGALGLKPIQYYTQTAGAISLKHFVQGLIKAGAFGVVIAICGCMQGIRCGRSAQAVGEATTKAVVQCIVWIVVVDALLTIIYVQTGF
jgi:phospholipid/cholesterol/gamma-HCH transport system permease protein